MSDRAYAKVQAQQKMLVGLSPQNSLLLRTCACGQHTIAGGECSACRSEQFTLHHSQRAFGPFPVPVAPQGNTPAQENGTSSNSAFERASYFGHDFSRIPVYSPHSPMLQTKLNLNQPGDVYEQEAGQTIPMLNHSLTSLPYGQHARKLPKELKYKVRSGDRARTWEETKIDLFGPGSALSSLVTSPWRTLKNAVKGLFSDFPSRATIHRQPAVQTTISAAWTAAQTDYSERFGWITWDKNADTYAVPAVSVGDQYRCTPPPKPVDPASGAASQVFHVGEFHIHPPLDPSIPGMANPHQWPIGPSETDEEAAQQDHSPGIVRDFDSIDRTGGVTDYTYGPWTRTE